MYRWAVEILHRDGTRVGQKVVEPDFAPLLECARLTYLRRHGPSAAADYDRPVEVTPVWSATLGEPYVGSLSMTIAGENVEDAGRTSIFRAAAGDVASQFVESGELAEGSTFVYLVMAYPGSDPDLNSSASRRFQISSLSVRVPVTDGLWQPVGGVAGVSDPGGCGVIVPQRLLDEVAELTVARRGVETGGVLLGRLRWDREMKDLFIEITEQVHARSAIGDEKRLQFTADCWAEIHATVALRRRGESIVGWWHSHPAQSWCGECPRERQEVCALQAGFLSEHDKTLHRTVFPRAFTTALVATDSALGDVRFSMFGWQGGALEKRGYHAVGAESGLIGSRRALVAPGREALTGSELMVQGGDPCEHPKSNF